MEALPVFLGLFLTSLVAGTCLPFLPGSSELAMAGLIAAQVAPPSALVATAVIANVTGAILNYVIGHNVAGLADRRWFPLSQTTLDKAAGWFNRYGVWTVALCWVPTFGDAITVVAGLLRVDLRRFAALVLAGKLFGHVAVALSVTWLTAN